MHTDLCRYIYICAYLYVCLYLCIYDSVHKILYIKSNRGDGWHNKCWVIEISSHWIETNSQLIDMNTPLIEINKPLMDTNRLLIRINRIPIRISRPLIAIHSQLKEINRHRIQINRTLIGLISWLASNPPLRWRKPSTCITQTIAMSGVFFVSKPPISPRITTRQNYRMF